MNNDYLSETDNSLSFKTLNEFESVIETLDPSVPNRSDGRKSFHRERSSLIMFLKALVAHSLLCFPFCVRKTESPDFILTIQGRTNIGIEHRDITSQGYQKILSR
jgi:hypothetical protein